MSSLSKYGIISFGVSNAICVVRPFVLPELFELFAELLELPFVDLELINKLIESDLLFGDFVLVQGFILQKSMAELLLAIFPIMGLMLVDFQRDDWQRPHFTVLWLTMLSI